MNIVWIIAGILLIGCLVLVILLQKSRANNSKHIDAKNFAQTTLLSVRAEYKLKTAGFETIMRQREVLYKDQLTDLSKAHQGQLDIRDANYKHSIASHKSAYTKLSNQLVVVREALRKQISIYNQYKEDQDEKAEVAEDIAAGDDDLIDSVLSHGPKP